MRVARPGDVALLVGLNDRKPFIRLLKPGGTVHTHHGYLQHDDLIGLPYGAQVKTHLGVSFYLLSPTTEELVRYLRRKSQIVFPKDAGYALMKLGVKPGTRVLEAGSGSGGFTLVLATAVGDDGHVYSYDVRDDMQSVARRNLAEVGLDHRVTFKLGDAVQGFDETDVDALFLDLREPWEVLDPARAALGGGGMLGCIVPTVNQLTQLLDALSRRTTFAFVEAEELLLRQYKTTPARVRPEDRMIGHTGYLVFARAVAPPEPGAGSDLLEAAVDEEQQADDGE